ncbi:MAG: hypothetical protein R3F49_16245 [Planctomycetota bacterium]
MKFSFLFPALVASSAALFAAAGSDVSTARISASDSAPRLVSETRAYVTMPPRSLEAYAGLAEALVQADVVGMRTIDVADQPLRTEYELRVAQCYFGEVGATVRVQVAGGRTETRSFVVEGAPRLALGDQGLFFLGGRTEGDALSFLGLSNGCYAVKSVGGEVFVQGGEHAQQATELDAFVARSFDARASFFAKEAR